MCLYSRTVCVFSCSSSGQRMHGGGRQPDGYAGINSLCHNNALKDSCCQPGHSHGTLVPMQECNETSLLFKQRGLPACSSQPRTQRQQTSKHLFLHSLWNPCSVAADMNMGASERPMRFIGAWQLQFQSRVLRDSDCPVVGTSSHKKKSICKDLLICNKHKHANAQSHRHRCSGQD